MLGIGRHTDYAARIVLHLAALPVGAQVTAAAIAEARLLPAAFIRRIIGKLATAGIVRTCRGAGGGVSLARPAAEISLLDVVVALEGGLVLNACVDSPTACPLAASCPVQKAWTTATATLTESLAKVRFDTLANPAEMHVTRFGYEARHGRCEATSPTRAGQKKR